MHWNCDTILWYLRVLPLAKLSVVSLSVLDWDDFCLHFCKDLINKYSIIPYLNTQQLSLNSSEIMKQSDRLFCTTFKTFPIGFVVRTLAFIKTQDSSPYYKPNSLLPPPVKLVFGTAINKLIAHPTVKDCKSFIRRITRKSGRNFHPITLSAEGPNSVSQF